MAPGSPLTPQPHPSPTKKSSQELPLFPGLSPTGDAPHPVSPARHTNGVNGASLLAIPEPGAAADLTPSLIADEMDVDNGTAAANEAAAAAAAESAEAAEVAAAVAAAAQPALVAPQPQSFRPSQSRAVRSPVRTPELQTTLPQRQSPTNGHGAYANGHQNHQNHQMHHQRGVGHTREAQEASPGTPGQIPPFDWEEFEARYEHALADMNGQEKELLEEFDRLVTYFNVWATASSAHDDERAVKRLQTRERYVRIAEQSLGQRKQHLTEVVRAFQSALALLSQT